MSLSWRIDRADCLPWLVAMPEQSVDLVFGSPPYEGARLYLEDGRDLGIARKTEDWVAWMVEVFRASLRVCKGLVAFVVEGQTRKYRYTAGPALLMTDLHRAGVTLRKPPIFHRVGIPGSGGPDWLRNDYEWIICATNGGKLPWSDNTACGHPPKWAPGGEMSYRDKSGGRRNEWGGTGHKTGGEGREPNGEHKVRLRVKGGSPKDGVGRRITSGHVNGDTPNADSYDPPAIANPGNVIHCKVGGGLLGSPLAHENEAPFPEQLAAFFVRSFCQPGGVVCDPFSGSGTTGAVAVRYGRSFLGCDVRQSQVELSRKRIETVTPESLFSG